MQASHWFFIGRFSTICHFLHSPARVIATILPVTVHAAAPPA
jgi:hypothetical protein